MAEHRKDVTGKSISWQVRSGKISGAYNKVTTKERLEKEKILSREIKSSLFMYDLKQGKLYDSGKEVKVKVFFSRQVHGMNDNLWSEVVMILRPSSRNSLIVATSAILFITVSFLLISCHFYRYLSPPYIS